MKKAILLFLLMVALENYSAQTYIKGNILSLPIGIANGALEAKINNQFTIQPEFFASPWKSFFSKRFQVYYFSAETRYYFKESFNGIYLGGNAGIALFDIQKWNYFNSTKYQRGYTFLLGFTVGYQYKINENFNADVFLGGGTSQGFYHGYNEINGERYEPKNPWNRSGELIPYKGGIMISYKLK